jgi:hypothetical protein
MIASSLTFQVSSWPDTRELMPLAPAQIESPKHPSKSHIFTNHNNGKLSRNANPI